jgi:hypothetical protein
MGSIIAVVFAWLAQLNMLPVGMQLQQQANSTATMITTAQQETQILNAAGPYIQQNLAAVQAAASASSPYIITIPQLELANIGPNGLPVGFSPTNPYGQTWQIQVLQPTPGNLQALVIGVNGAGAKKLTDMQASAIAGYAGQAGGFVSLNDSGIYPTGHVYGNNAGWNISSTGYQNITGGQPAALLVINNGQQQNSSLYRVAVPGQPQLNTMSTTLDMGANQITNANGIVTAGGSNQQSVQVGQTYYYGDSAGNSAIRGNGALSIQNQAGTAPANIGSVGSITSSGNIWATNGAVTAAAVHSTGYVQVDGYAAPGGACYPNGLMGNSGQGPLFCQSGVWTAAGGALMISAQYQLANGTGIDAGWHSFCFLAGVEGYPEGGMQYVYPVSGPNSNSQYDWNATNGMAGNYDPDMWVTCMDFH